MAESLAVKDWDMTQLNTMRKARTYVQALLQTVPRDGLGRLSALVDPSAILQTGMVQEVERFVDAPPTGCLMPVSLFEGIPTLEGVPVWEKWENEPADYYELFKRYRNIQDAKLPRSVYRLSVEQNLPTRTIEVLRQVYQWQERCLAWDDYTKKERELQLELRRQEIENRHAKTAERLFSMASEYLDDHKDLITPKVALQMLELAIRLERVAAGMSLENKRGNMVGGEVAINIQNNVESHGGAQTSDRQPTPGTQGTPSDAKERLTQVVNLMQNLDILKTDVVDAEVIEVEAND